jgi:hypothetical protein
MFSGNMFTVITLQINVTVINIFFLYNIFLYRWRPQAPAHGSVPSQVATHLATDNKVYSGWGGAGFQPGTAALLSGALPLSRLSSSTNVDIHINVSILISVGNCIGLCKADIVMSS